MYRQQWQCRGRPHRNTASGTPCKSKALGETLMPWRTSHQCQHDRHQRLWRSILTCIIFGHKRPHGRMLQERLRTNPCRESAKNHRFANMMNLLRVNRERKPNGGTGSRCYLNGLIRSTNDAVTGRMCLKKPSDLSMLWTKWLFMARTPTFHVVSNVHVVFLKNSQEICEQLAPSFFKQTCILSTGALSMPRVREDAIVWFTL